MELRPYQLQAIDALWDYWRTKKGTPLIVAATGSGKSVILAEICRRVIAAKPHYKIVVVSHRKEIIEQNAAELYRLLKIPIGIYSAGLNQKTIRPITCANIQSIWKKQIEANLIICDECHLIPRNSASMYQKFLTGIPNAKVMGLTATPMRLDQGSLVGPTETFTDICFDISISELIASGFLSPLISKRNNEKIDFSDVRKAGFDFNQGELEAKFNPLILRHAQEIKERTKDRKHVLIFCSGIKHAKEMAESLGNEADYVSGEMLGYERDRKLNAFSSGNLKYLCNCEVLTTGYNFPGIDCIVLLRATQSAALYVQAVGRGSRLAEGKTNCLVLDFGGNVDRHGPVDLVQVKKKGKGKKSGPPPTKTCPKCGAVLAIRVRVCPDCANEFPVATCIEEEATEKPIISEPVILEVIHQNQKLHRKEGKPPSLRLLFRGNLNEVSEFLCFEHGGYAAEMARKKWAFYGGKLPAPKTSEEGLSRCQELKVLKKIEIKQEGKYYRVLRLLEEQLPFDAVAELGINI